MNLLSFMINTSKSIDTSQFLDWHIPFIYRIHWKQSTFHSFAIERRRHCFYYSNSVMIEENNDWIIVYSVVNNFNFNNKHANKQGVKTETLCYINGSVNSLHKFINNEQYNTKQQTQVTDFFGLICDTHEMNIQIKCGYIELLIYGSIYFRSLGLQYIRVLLYLDSRIMNWTTLYISLKVYTYRFWVNFFQKAMGVLDRPISCPQDSTPYTRGPVASHYGQVAYSRGSSEWILKCYFLLSFIMGQ